MPKLTNKTSRCGTFTDPIMETWMQPGHSLAVFQKKNSCVSANIAISCDQIPDISSESPYSLHTDNHK